MTDPPRYLGKTQNTMSGVVLCSPFTYGGTIEEIAAQEDQEGKPSRSKYDFLPYLLSQILITST